MFHVDSQKAVSTWSTPCELKIYQLLKDHIGLYYCFICQQLLSSYF